MKLRRPRLTYANVVATIALFAALGGVSYAATALPKNSVGAGQIQAEAIRTGKIADGAVTASKLGQGVRERIAASGVTPATVSTPESVKHADTADKATTASTAAFADRADSAAAATHADSADDADTADVANTAKDADSLGGQPADHYMTANSVLRSGQTEAGDYIAAAGNGEAGTVLVQFWPHLPESLQEGHIKVLGEGAPGTSECPAPGEAAPSYLCVYQSFNEGMSFESFISTMPGSIYAGPVSGVMTWRSNQFNGLLRGTWAYTAP
ncbi:MAG TPA: hypothetical protein VFJ61_01215 [Solirubrobacterales bacterium]|nr:hypothetical protein [Solirubrobacterales bacterium]